MPRIRVMLHPVTFRVLALAACGFALAGQAAALTLGRASGSVLVGRPLEVTVAAELDAPATEAPCAQAEAQYGDPGTAKRTSLRWEPRAGGREGVLRITVAEPVDEPVVALNVQLGCGRTVSRRFVLLADIPAGSEPSAPVAVPARPAPAATPVPGPAAPAAPERPRTNVAAAPAAAGPAATPNAATPPAAAPAARPARPAAAAPAPAPTPAPAPARNPRAAREPERAPDPGRLRLDLLEPGAERDPQLKLSTDLSAVGNDPQARVAAAALWEVLRKGPEEAAQDATRVRNLERELSSLRTVTQQNAAAAASMREQVERVQGQRGQLAWAAGALVLALAAFAAWAVWRWRQSARMAGGVRWFPDSGAGPAMAPAEPEEPMPPIISETPKPTPAPARPAATPKPRTVAPGMATTIARTKSQPSVWAPVEGGDFQASQGGTLRMVGVQELIDVHDKADFFFSIGQPDQAAAVLEAHVHDQVETSALPWLDLLELYHKQGLRSEYERLRAEFLQRFPAQVPDFDHFDQPTQSLEDYSRALSRIVALWPTRRVLDVIEEAIFRRPGVAGADAFTLEAYRELVLLYHIAMEVAPTPEQGYVEGAQRGPEFSASSLQPLATLDRPQLHPPETRAPAVAIDERLIPPSSRRIGVDIDLDEPSVLPEDDEEDEDVTPAAAAPAPAGNPPRAELPALDFDIEDAPGGTAPKRK